MSRSRRQRRGAARAAARARVSDLVVRPLSPEQRAFDPTDHRRQRAGARVAGLAGLVLGSAVTHALLVGAGVLVAFLVPDDEEEKDDGPVAVEVREREPEPEPDKPPEPAPVDVTPRRIEKASKPPPRPVEPPPADPPPKAPPRRVVGLSFESTVGGGSGSTFAAGETRSGTTEKTAADPARKKAPPPTPETGTGNKQATRIPTAGVKLLLPKRKKPVVPDYPPALKAQGIEADVPVMVSLDATGAVTSVKILKSSGHPELDEAARKAALAESFEPASRDGVAIPYTLSYTYRFRLEDG